jgi:hypothetical protein
VRVLLALTSTYKSRRFFPLHFCFTLIEHEPPNYTRHIKSSSNPLLLSQTRIPTRTYTKLEIRRMSDLSVPCRTPYIIPSIPSHNPTIILRIDQGINAQDFTVSTTLLCWGSEYFQDWYVHFLHIAKSTQPVLTYNVDCRISLRAHSPAASPSPPSHQPTSPFSSHSCKPVPYSTQTPRLDSP